MGLSNDKAKQAYYSGVAIGICEQLEKSKAKVESEIGLVVTEREQLERVFQEQNNQSISSRRSKYNGNSQAQASGALAGKNLKIRSGLKTGKAKQSGKFIGN